MKIRIITTGPGKMEHRHFGVNYGKNIQTLFFIAYFFGIVISWGAFDVVAQFRAMQLPRATYNRAQRRRLNYLIKKQRHAHAL